MRRSGNRLGRSIIRAIHPHAPASGRYSPQADEQDIRRAHVGHVAIYEQLVQRDADGAAAAMQEHIRGTWTQRKANAPDRCSSLADRGWAVDRARRAPQHRVAFGLRQGRHGFEDEVEPCLDRGGERGDGPVAAEHAAMGAEDV